MHSGAPGCWDSSPLNPLSQHCTGELDDGSRRPHRTIRIGPSESSRQRPRDFRHTSAFPLLFSHGGIRHGRTARMARTLAALTFVGQPVLTAKGSVVTISPVEALNSRESSRKRAEETGR